MSESTRTRSHSKSRHSASSDRPLFPFWAPPLVMIAVTITGLILAAESGTAPMAYFVLFAVACVICTVLVEPRGLFLTVAAQPLYFLIGALAIGWLSAQKTAGNNTKTKIITAVYPTIEHFLWLLLPFLISVVIAFIRWRRHRRLLARRQKADTSARRKRRTSDDSNRAAYSRTRRHASEDDRGEREDSSDHYESRHGGGSNSRSVEELIRRSEERRAARAERERGRHSSPLPPRHSAEDSSSESPVASSSVESETGGRHSLRSRSPLPKKRAPYLDDEFTLEDD